MKRAGLAAAFLLVAISALAAKQYNLEVMDWFGRSVRLASAPKKVVSLSDTSTEMIFAIGRGDMLAGVSEDSSYPPEAGAVRKVPFKSGEYDPAVLAEIAPDIIVACRKSRKIGLAPRFLEKTYLMNPWTLGEVLRAMVELGRLTAREMEAKNAARALKDRMDRVSGRLANAKRVTGLVMVDSGAGICAGDKSIEGDILAMAGVKNLLRAVEYGSVGWNDIASMKPDFIIAAAPGATTEAVMARLKAGEGGPKVFGMPPERICRPGPRLFDGLEEIARRVHPEAFR